jgi:hypothetical protein
MIANISPPSSSPRGALNYNCKKVEDGEAKILQTNRIWQKYSGEFTANELAYIFEKRAAVNKNTKNPFVHISLNPSPDDTLTDEQLTKIADEYMKKMGYGNQPYVVFKHEDIDRHHLHIVTTNVDAQGKKIAGIDSNERHRSKKITREIERKYKLHPADIKKGDASNAVWLPKKVDATKNVSNQIRNVVRYLTENYKFQSFNEYRALLSLYNIDAQEVKGEVVGTVFEGVIYSPTDDKHNRIANPVKSSALGKFAGAKKLQKIYEKSAATLDVAAKDSIRTTLLSAMKTAKSEKDLISLLKNKDVDLILRKNYIGRIYGATIIDHQTKSVVNGSRLGKEFSANKFNELLNSAITSATSEQIKQQAEIEISATSEQAAQQPLFAFSITGGVPLFTGGAGSSAPRKKKKKKKKKTS